MKGCVVCMSNVSFVVHDFMEQSSLEMRQFSDMLLLSWQ